MLLRLDVDNFRTLVKFAFDAPSSAVLVGANGSGKSAICDVLAGIQDVALRGASVEDAFPTSSLTRWRDDDQQTFALELRGATETFRYELVVAHDRDKQTAVIARETLRIDDSIVYHVTLVGVHIAADDGTPFASPIAFDRRRSFLATLEPREDNRRVLRFRHQLGAFWLFQLDPRRMEATSKREATWLERSGANFAAWYRHFAQECPAALAPLFGELREALPSFVHLKSAANGGARELFATFRDPIDKRDYDLSFDELSEGQRALVVLYAVLQSLPEGPALLVLDEPENFIAPAEIQPLLTVLRRVCDERRVQRLLLSHHPGVIDYMAADQALEATRPGGGATVVAPLEVDLDSGLRASDVVALGHLDPAPSEKGVGT